MRFDQQDKQLQQYLQKLLEFQREMQKPELDNQELRRIALEEVGMTTKQWEQLQQKYQQHFHRGQSFAEFGNWKEAIEEYEQALALRPNQLPLLYDLARAYKNCFSDTLDRNDRRRAEFYAKKCLHLDPQFSKASQLLKDVQVIAKRLQQKPKRKGIFSAYNVILFLVVAALATVGVLLLWPSSIERAAEGPELQSPEVAGQPEVEVVNGEQTGLQDLSLQWRADEESVREFIRLKGQYRKIGGGMTIKVRGWAKVPEDKELENLTVQASLMANGKAVAQKSFDVYRDYKPTLRPGDPIPIGINWYFKESPVEQPEQLQLTVQQAELLPAGRRYPEAEPYPLLDETGQEQQGIVLRMRRSPYDAYGYHKLNLELQNQTGQHIRQLKLQLSYFDRKGEELASQVHYPISKDGPVLRDGEQLVWGVTQRYRPRGSRKRAAELKIQIEAME